MFFHGIGRGSLRRAEYGGVTRRQSSTKRALGGKDGPDIMKAFTRRCVWDESNFATYRILVLNLATEDVPDVIISLLWRPCKHGFYLFGHNIIVYYIGLQKVVQAKSGIAKFCLSVFAEVSATLRDGAIIHIGMGSDVVCSTKIGNVRALTRGTYNRTTSRFFYVLNWVLSRAK